VNEIYGVMTTQLMEKHAPYINGMHFMAHGKNSLLKHWMVW
jgi:hypothetical protein